MENLADRHIEFRAGKRDFIGPLGTARKTARTFFVGGGVCVNR
jgi:hypothetical protein